MRPVRDFKPEWWVATALAGVLVGWWLAMRRMGAKVAARAAVVVEDAKAVLEPPALPLLSKRSEDYLTVREVARYVSLCEKSVRREIDARRLPSYRVRGKVTVKGSDVSAWLSARREA